MASQNPLRALSFAPIKPHINPNVLLYTPAASPGQDAPSGPASPKVIILTTWMGGATPARIAVYCRAYQRLYPFTPILIIRTQMQDYSLVNRWQSRVQARLSPAHDYLASLFATSQSSSGASGGSRQHGALLHCFSNGGCFTAVQLGKMLRRSSRGKDALHLPIPFVGVVFDSCPGGLSFENIYDAISFQLPQSQPAYSIGRMILWPYVRAYVAYQKAGIVTSPDDVMRDLNDVSLFGSTPRLYLYARNDTVIAPSDIAAHADGAAELGLDVKREVYEDAIHCALPLVDANRYWNAIEAFVSTALKDRNAKL
jgi:DNA repair protein RAD57